MTFSTDVVALIAIDSCNGSSKYGLRLAGQLCTIKCDVYILHYDKNILCHLLACIMLLDIFIHYFSEFTGNILSTQSGYFLSINIDRCCG